MNGTLIQKLANLIRSRAGKEAPKILDKSKKLETFVDKTNPFLPEDFHNLPASHRMRTAAIEDVLKGNKNRIHDVLGEFDTPLEGDVTYRDFRDLLTHDDRAQIIESLADTRRKSVSPELVSKLSNLKGAQEQLSPRMKEKELTTFQKLLQLLGK